MFYFSPLFLFFPSLGMFNLIHLLLRTSQSEGTNKLISHSIYVQQA